MTRSSAPPSRPPALLTTALAALAAGLALAGGAAPAYAHGDLRSSNPADGATLAQPPAQVVLTFEEAPVELGAQVVVTGPDGVVSTGAPRVASADVVQDVQPSAPAGRYTVEWRVASDDGHPASGTLAFTAQAAAAGGSPSAAAPTPAATAAPAEAPRREPLIPSWGWIAAGVIAIVAAIRLNRRASALNKQQED
ncbi:copper resistance protein CopC [Microlunatus spumicola]|uniref:Copper resistance protein CopC n=1 Tax=Microlunatus spumicola TaxID=81499 RepID=A0ABP6XLE3_9ACTN